jgi:hypothetical protein
MCAIDRFSLHANSRYVAGIVSMKYALLGLSAIALSITVSSQSAQASAYKTASGSTYLEVGEVAGTVGAGRYDTIIAGQLWRGSFTLTASTVGSNRVYTGNFIDRNPATANTASTTQSCQGTLTLTRPSAITNNPTPMTAAWTIGPGGVNCPSPIGTTSTLYLVEAIPVAASSGDFLPTAINGNTLISETAGIATWPKWKVIDPTGLNCRKPAPTGPIITTFAFGSNVTFAVPMPNKFVTAGGNPWLVIGNYTCFVRAKNTYLKPVVMPF